MAVKIFAMYVLVMFIISCGRSKSPFISMELSKAFEISKEEDKCIFIYLRQDGCGACDYMSTKIFNEKNVKQLLVEEYISIRKTVPDDLADPLVHLFQLTGFPSYIILNPQREVQYVSVGVKKTAFEFLDEFKGVDTIEPSFFGGYNNRDNKPIIEVLSKTFKAYSIFKSDKGKLGLAKTLLQESINEEAYFYNTYLMYSILVQANDSIPPDAQIYGLKALSFQSSLDDLLYSELKQEISRELMKQKVVTGLSLEREEVDFGTVKNGTAKIANILFTNENEKAIKIRAVKETCSALHPEWEHESILYGQNGKIWLYFEPKRKGNYSEDIYIISNAPNSPVKVKIKAKVV